ncbi:MAG: chitobiase/beta-hexosaminidase C-terminal domain-containing protein [Paramuribaculum sp.]|nr:chitobiase/beta-hexosaminidase C-terminal domain-containing protein [Paramuribaculum sp.]
MLDIGLDVTASSLTFYTFEVTYFVDDGTLPKENEVTYGLDYATPIEYTKVENPTEADWTTARGFSPIAIDGAKVLVRLGKTVTTFTAPTPAKAATVIIDPAKGLIGATAGTSFFTKLTTSDDDQFYKVEYLYNYKTSTFTTGYQTVAANLNPPAGATAATAPNIVSYVQDRDNSITAANATYTVKTSGLKDIFTGVANAALADGKDMCVAFDGIRVSYVSKDAAAIPPMAPVVTIPDDAKPAGDHKYKTLGDFDVTVRKNTNDSYTDVVFKYRFEDNEFVDVPADGKISITGDCVLDVKAVSAEHGESGIVSYSFDKLENIVNVDKASELEGLKAGTLVRLNCPLQMLADGCFKTNADDHYIFTHDTEYRSVPLVVRGEKTKPSNAFQPSPRTAIDAQNFIPEGGVVGTLEFENGRPVIVLKDQEGIDNYSLCYAGSAVLHYNSANVGKNYVRFTYTHNRRTEILPEDFGSIINIDATYSSSTGKFTVKKAGADGQGNEPIELDVRQLSNNFVITTPNSYSTATNPTADGDYTLCGLVGYDYDSKSYFLLPRFIGKKLPELTIEPVAGSYATPTKFVKPDGDKPGRLYLEMTGKQFGLKLEGSDNTNQYYCIEVDSPGNGSSLTDTYKPTNSAHATIDVEVASIPADEPLKLLVYLNGQGASSDINPETTMLYSARMYHLEVYNAVEGADEYTSIAKLLQDAKEHPEEMNAYVRLTCPNMAIAVVRDNRSSNESDWNCMVVKDITSLINGEENADIPSLPLIFKNGIGMFSSSYFQYSNTTDKYYKNPRPGEYVQEMTFRVRIDENGNLTGDLTDFDQRYKSYAASAETHFGYNPELRPGEPWFKKHVGSITLMEDIIKADEAVFTADHLDKLVTIAGVKIAAQEPVVRSGGIDALADEPAQKTYVAKMAKDVRLEWSIFPSTDEKTVDHTIIDNIGADATYTITGLVRADADGGHFIEVLDLDPVFGKKLAVCGHEHHVTYYDQDIDNVKLSPEQIGTVVELTGMNLAGNDADGFTTVTRQPVKLDFSSVASKTDGWKNQAKEAVDNGLAVKLMGTLSGAEDGSAYTLNVLTYDNLSSEAVDGNLALTFDGVTFDPEHTEFYSVGKLGCEAPDGVHVYYTMVDPAEMEFDESATDEQKAAKIAEKLAALPETLLDNAKGVVADRTVWVRLTTCTPGEAPIKAQVYEVTKRSTDVNTIAEVVKAQSADGKGIYHVRSPWLVTDKGTDRVIVTDGLIHAALHVSGQNASLPEVGSHLQEFAVAKGAAGMHPDYTYAFGLSGNDLHRVTVDAPATPVKAPEVENVASVSADSHGHLVGFTDVKLAGNKTAGFALKDAFAADGGAATDLAVNNSLGISLDQMLDDDTEALYRIVGYAMPSAAGGMELWPAEVIRRTKIATVPVITLSAEKSLEPATVTISCADESLTIEYSTDGGKNWIEYTGEFYQFESAVIKARASKAYLDSSDEDAAAFTRLYISPAPMASFEESDGMTKVTLGSSAAGAASGSYSIYYTLDGSIPTKESALYTDTAPIEVTSAGTVIKAILIDNDPEAVESAVKEWPVAFTPALSGDVAFDIKPEAGKTVITISGPGTISYSFDGVTYVVYKDPIVITNDGQTDLQGTIHAFAQEDGKRPGAVKEESYRVSGIGSLSADGAAGVSVDGSTIVAPEGSMVFDITGRRVGLTGLRRGIYIVRLPDGKAVKVSVR